MLHCGQCTLCGLWAASLCFPPSLDHSDQRGATLVTYVYGFNVTVASFIHSTIHSFNHSFIHSVVGRPTAADTQRIIQVGLTAVGSHCAVMRHISPMETCCSRNVWPVDNPDAYVGKESLSNYATCWRMFFVGTTLRNRPSMEQLQQS